MTSAPASPDSDSTVPKGSPSQPIEPGVLLKNRYRLEAQVGRGGMGRVFRAIDTQYNEVVAVKVLSSELSLEPEMVERFRREGEALRQLRHPNIVNFVDMFVHGDHHIIVAEFISGGSLLDLIRKGALPLERVRHIAIDICDALTRAHRLNIIHRDIKPANILIGKDGSAKLTDFGIARLINENTHLTRTGTLIGTPQYIAPEVWMSQPVDGQADIWSLGVVLYELLTGSVPFEGDSLITLMNNILKAPIPELGRLRPETPDWMVQIISGMLTRDKNERYLTIREVAVDLERGPSNRVRSPVPAPLPVTIAQTQIGPGPTVAMERARPSAQPGFLPAQPKPQRKFRWGLWLVLAAGMLGISLVCVVLAYWFSPDVQGLVNAYISPPPTQHPLLSITLAPIDPPTISASDEARKAWAGGVKSLEERAISREYTTGQNVQANLFTVALRKNDPVLLFSGWCSDSAELLAAHERSMTYLFMVDEKPVPSDRSALEANLTATSTGATRVCNYYYIYLDQWPAGIHQLDSIINITSPIADSQGSYPVGMYINRYIISAVP
jgi:hypothetical protein